MECWVGIESCRYWWSTKTPSMDKGDQFRLNRIMSSNRVDSILGDICFTNRDVPYEDGSLQIRQLDETWKHNISQ